MEIQPTLTYILHTPLEKILLSFFSSFTCLSYYMRVDLYIIVAFVPEAHLILKMLIFDKLLKFSNVLFR